MDPDAQLHIYKTMFNTNNYDLRWRIWAKTIAVFDLISAILQLVLVLTVFAAASGASAAVVISIIPGYRQVAEDRAWIIWISILIATVIAFIGFFGGLRLFLATKLGQQQDIAYQSSRLWQIFSTASIILIIIEGIIANFFILMVIRILIRIIFMFLVYCFMREVQAKNNAPPQQTIR